MPNLALVNDGARSDPEAAPQTEPEWRHNMKRCVLTAFILASALTTGAAQAKSIPAQPSASASAQAAKDHSSQTDANWNGVPAYLMHKDGTLINGLLPTNPDAQG